MYHKLLALVVFGLAVCRGTAQDARGPVTVKFHEAKTEVSEAFVPVEDTVRIKVSPTGAMGLGLYAEGNKLLCCGDGAIRTNFKIDNQIAHPGSAVATALPPGPFNKKRVGWTSTFTFNNIHITQEMEVVPSKPNKERGDTKRRLDALLIKYIIENKSDQQHMVGTRCRIDTLCEDNDGALFAAPTKFPGKVLDGIELKDKSLPDFVQILQRPDLKNPGLVGYFTLKMDAKMRGPDRFLCTSHRVGDNGWDVPVQQANGDSDCVLFWDPQPIPARSKVVMAYAYGTGIATMPESEGRLKLSFGGSFEPGKVFTITAYVDEPIPSQALTLDLPAGMERIEGREIQPVPAPDPERGSSVVLWKARVTRTGEFPVRIRSSNGVVLSRTISITPAGNP